MAFSTTDIANLALVGIGEAEISSIDDASKAARLCNRNLPLMRDELLRAYDWNCARAQATLPAMAEVPLFRWARKFQLPADYLCMHSTEDDDDDPCGQVEWEIQGRVILTDEAAPLNITYTRQEANPAVFDAGFAVALGARIAMQIALALTGSAQTAAKAESDFNRAIASARGSSFRERRKAEDTPSWIAARY